MSATTVVRTPAPQKSGSGWATPLNLHWLVIGLLTLLNLYLLAHIVLLWHRSSSFNDAAFEQQRTELRIATVAAQPLHGLDGKLALAASEADRFYSERLPQTYSAVASELGMLTAKTGVKLTGAQYTPVIVLPNATGQLTELDIDSRLSGDYRPLMLFLNSLERDKMFFVIRAVTFNGQQSGTVNLRLRLTTYLRGGAPAAPVTSAAPDASAATSKTTTPRGPQ
jgi:type IV pilus assembly protein PilO